MMTSSANSNRFAFLDSNSSGTHQLSGEESTRAIVFPQTVQAAFLHACQNVECIALSDREGAPSNKKGTQEQKSITGAAKRGTLSAVPSDSLLDLAFTGQPIVALLTPGEQVR